MRLLHLCDVLHEAEIRAPSPAHVEIQVMDVGGEQRTTLFQHPDSEVRITLPEDFPGGRLELACGIATRAWERIGGPVAFRIGLGEGEGIRLLHEVTLDPRSNRADRRWVAVDLEVPPGRVLALQTRVPGGRTANAWAGWADPVLRWEASAGPPARRRRRRRAPARNLLLVTADSLRADHLGCYGNREIPTPHIDRLAEEGLRFAHARANATITPGSYASLLTGLYPPGHGFVAEWGTLPPHVPTLASVLAAAGYRTILAASEREVAAPDQGFAQAFAETLPILANPHQPGDMTTRRVTRWLEGSGEDSWFLWVSYFDTHPPYHAPDRLLRLFYQGDPRDPARSSRPEDVRKIHGIETIQGLETSLVLMERGTVDPRLVERLRATAAALLGEERSGPDLAAHVARLGADVRLGLSPGGFGRWLRDRAEALAEGRLDPRLLRWIREMLDVLREEERGMLAWVDGVVDHAYPVAQTKASVAHLDEMVGALLSTLKAEGLYEDCTIVLTSPHGELLGEGGHHFHHHASREEVLRVPVIVKPGRHMEGLGPGVVEGVLESVDLLPTLAEALGVSAPQVAGVSVLADLRAGRPLPDRNSFALDVNGVRASVCRPPHKVVRWLRWDVEGGEPVPPGTNRLFELRAGGEVPLEDPDVAARLEAALDAWLSEQGMAGPDPSGGYTSGDGP